MFHNGMKFVKFYASVKKCRLLHFICCRAHNIGAHDTLPFTFFHSLPRSFQQFTDNPGAFTDYFIYIGQVSCIFEINFNSKEEKKMEKERFDKRLLLGIFILLAGIILLANNFGMLHPVLNYYIFRWEMILIVLGLVFIISRGNLTTGIILLFIGAAFYARDIWHLHVNFWQLFLPALLILAGVMVMFRSQIDRYWVRTPLTDEENQIDDTAIFGGGDRLMRSQQFKGGRITAVFGGSSFDLRKAKLAPGTNVIDVFCLFGGTKLIIPDDWNIKVRVTSIFGGFGDKRHILPEVHTNEETQLVITGLVVFGGGEIKSYPD
jgi:predicted membrane protein